MGITLYRIKKWMLMLMGKSISHVAQGPGLYYSKCGLDGYYNDLTEKVLKRVMVDCDVPMSTVETGERIFFPIEIFQYGLGAYDLYLKKHEECYLKKIYACANWAVENQNNSGGWETFLFKNKDQPYSSMAQAEGISLLLRVYKETKNEKYLKCAQKALLFMIKPVSEGGTTLYEGDDVIFLESTFFPAILNGWIFSIWGLLDYCKVVPDENVKQILKKSMDSLERHLPSFDLKYWSRYDEKKMISSPFYHHLHIAQLKVMYDITGRDIFKVYEKKWDVYERSFFCSKIAFMKKAFQKLFD